ncbi:unnamed protein product, partial [Acanthoscelides obtectus]
GGELSREVFSLSFHEVLLTSALVVLYTSTTAVGFKYFAGVPKAGIMRILVCIFLLLFTATEIRTEDTESTKSNSTHTLATSASSLDENFRKALLKALTELENEDKTLQLDRDQVIEKAHASSVSIFANSDSSISSTTFSPLTTVKVTRKPKGNKTPQTTTEKKQYVLLQKSEQVGQKTVTSIESDNDIDNEQILTSASNSFAEQYSKSATNEKSVRINGNSIDNAVKSTRISSTTTTTTPIPTSTEESEAKVEDVQFFSAPLVAAFTVHQDALGLPKSIEPIYKIVTNRIEGKNQQKVADQNELLVKQQTQFLPQHVLQKGFQVQSQQNVIQSQQFGLQSRQKGTFGNEVQPQTSPQPQLIPQNNQVVSHNELQANQNRQQLSPQPQLIAQNNQNELQSNQNRQLFRQQGELHSKINAQDLEIQRLNLNLKQQQHINQQQQQVLLSNQQRLNNKEAPFLPIVNPIQNQIGQQLPIREAELFRQKPSSASSVSLLPSLSFDPLIEAGKLPINGQILPIKGPTNFHAPIIHTPDFQQFRSLSNPAPQILSTFQPVNQLPVAQNFNQFGFGFPQPQGTRFFRQETGVGNFGVSQGGNFPVLQNIQPPPVQNEIFRPQPIPNRFFRSSAESTFQSPGTFFQPPQNQNGNRFFRSNLESSFSNNNYNRQQEHNFNLNNLLLNSGAFQGRTEDFNIVSKVLSLNHLGGRAKRHKVPHY